MPLQQLKQAITALVIAGECLQSSQNRWHEESLRVVPEGSFETSRATIIDKSERTKGLIALDWSEATTLREVTADGKQVIAEWSSPPMSVSKPDGSYYFEAQYCAVLPFSGESCWSVDSRVIILSSSEEETRYPEPVEAQFQYEYRIRTGNFNDDSRTDFYIERLTSGPADGSMRSYVVWKDSFGNVITSALDPAYEETAASAPISDELTLNQTDVNADGYADHVIEGLLDASSVEGFNETLEQSVIVYAPGVASDKTVPQGTKTIDQDFQNFFIDVARGIHDPQYFEEIVRLMNEPQPVWGLRWECGFEIIWTWYGEVLVGTYCRPYWTVVGYRTVPREYLRAVLATTSIFVNAGNSEDLASLWSLSTIVAEILGVPLFGFNGLGVFIGPNYHDDRWTLQHQGFWSFIQSIVIYAQQDPKSYPSV